MNVYLEISIKHRIALGSTGNITMILWMYKIRNQGNTNGFLSLGWFALLNENKTVYNYYKDAYAALKNPLLDGASGVTIQPDTEITIYLPFTMQYGAENYSILDENDTNNVYYFDVSRYPTRKEIKVLI